MTVVSLTSFSQAAQQKLDEVKKDPKTIESAAKADAGLINKKNITGGDAPQTTTPKKKFRRNCRSKNKNKITSYSMI